MRGSASEAVCRESALGLTPLLDADKRGPNPTPIDSLSSPVQLMFEGKRGRKARQRGSGSKAQGGRLSRDCTDGRANWLKEDQWQASQSC
jgi:hypothetical protein